MSKQRTPFGGVLTDRFPFECKYCGEAKKTSQALSSHIYYKHPEKWCAGSTAGFDAPGSAIGGLILRDPPDEDEPDCVVVEARGQKLTKQGLPKQTRGRPKCDTVSASVKLRAVQAHLATKEVGHPVMDDFGGRACGTRFSYNSVYNWRRKLPELEKLAVKENKSKLSHTKKGWFRRNPLIQKFGRKFQKALRKPRRAARKLTTPAALAIALHIYEKMDKNKGNVSWPTVRKTGLTWRPSKTWVQAWFHSHDWRPRKPTKTRRATREHDSAAMQNWLDKMRYVVNQQPGEVTMDRHPDYGITRQTVVSTEIKSAYPLILQLPVVPGLLRKRGHLLA